MDTKVIVRNFEPPDEFKTEMAKRLDAVIEKHHIRPVESTLIFNQEKSRYTAEVNIRIKGSTFHVHDEDYSVHECFEKAAKKIETQIRRFKDKKVSLKKKTKPSGGLNENS